MALSKITFGKALDILLSFTQFINKTVITESEFVLQQRRRVLSLFPILDFELFFLQEESMYTVSRA